MSERETAFEEAIENTLNQIRELLIVKGKEYRRNNNPFHNFERGSTMINKTREDILQGFLLKHLISVEDMRKDIKIGSFPTKEKIHEKYNDIVVYFLIEKAMMLENTFEYNKKLDAARRV